MYRVVSLFSGAGGLDWGFVASGEFKIVHAVEISASAAKTYSENFGLKLEFCGGRAAVAVEGAVLACDVSSVDFSPLGRAGVDVVVGGPPCQDFSVVRGPDLENGGIKVVRGRLYAHFVRALVQLQPKLFVFENVPGLAAANGGLAYRVILEDFQRLNLRWPEVSKAAGLRKSGRASGYEVLFSGIVDFSVLGVPQRRRRLIIMGVRRDLADALGREALSELNSLLTARLAGASLPFAKYPLTPLEVFEGRRLDELQHVYADVMRAWEDVWEEVRTSAALEWKQKVWDSLTFDVVEDYLRVNGVKPSSPGELEDALKAHEAVLRELNYYGVRVCSQPLPDGTCEPPAESGDVVERLKRIPPGENHKFVQGTSWEVEGKGISLIYRRLHPLKPAYTIVAYGGGGTHGYHYDRRRSALTLRERARLQTFPDSFLFSGSRSEIRAQIGEAVPPLAAKRIAEAVYAVLKLLEGHSLKPQVAEVSRMML